MSNTIPNVKVPRKRVRNSGLWDLRKTLPYWYAEAIAQELANNEVTNKLGITNRTVRRVFNGEITNLTTVEHVTREAQALRERIQKLDELKKVPEVANN